MTMPLQNPRYADAGNTRIVADVAGGGMVYVPVDQGNREYRSMLAAGTQIAAYQAPAPTSSDVNAERDRRIRTFPFGGRSYDLCDGKGSDINIAGAGTLALAAIVAGAQAGNLRWADPGSDFTWVAADNATVTMDALTCLNFAQTAASWKAKHIRCARVIKDMSPIPADYASDSRWA